MAAASYYQSSPSPPPPLNLTHASLPPISTEMSELPSNPHSPQRPADQYHQYPISSYETHQQPDESYKPHQQSDESYQPHQQLEESYHPHQQAEIFNSTGHAPSTNDPPLPDKPKDRLRRRRFEKWKRYLKILKSSLEAITTIINIIIFGIMVWVNVSYYRSQHEKAGDEPFWPNNLKIWPSLMLLAASFVSLLVSIGTLIVYCVNSKRARSSWKVTIAKYVLGVAVWIAVSTIYKQEKTTNDLWGWSCSSKADAVQKASNGRIDFSRLCTVQVSSSQQACGGAGGRREQQELIRRNTGELVAIIDRAVCDKDTIRHRTFLAESQDSRRKAEIC